MGFKNDDNFDSQSYVKVNDRLASFKAKYPESRIVTSADVLDGVLIMKAELFKDDKSTTPMATGHSFLTDIDSGDKVGEYTETVAVGRALAFAGEQVEKSIATAEEMDRFNKSRSNTESEEDDEESEVEESRTAAGRRNPTSSKNVADSEEDDEEEEQAPVESKPRARRGFKLPSRNA